MSTSTTARTVELSVSGMTCDGCSSAVEGALVALPGVRSASVDHASGRAVVLLAEDADAEAFAFDADAAVHDAGYVLEGAEVVTVRESCCGGGGHAARAEAPSADAETAGSCCGGGSGGCC